MRQLLQHRACAALLAAAACLASADRAAAMTADEVFAKVSPSVWRVQTYDADGLPLAIGSGVVIAPDTLVTNCHVLAKARRVAVKRDKLSIDAKLEMWDPQRDLCQIKATNLGAPAVALGEVARLEVGQNVFAIGSPMGLDLTMSAGLLSSIRRNEQGQVFLLQTSAAISGGSSGGGLFDGNAVLIGLTTLNSIGDAQNLNFAIPVDWIKELPQRYARLTKPAQKPPAAREPLSLPEPKIRVSQGTPVWNGWVEQDGQRFAMSPGGTVRLKRAPFKLLFDVDPKSGIWLAASQSPQLFEDFKSQPKRLGFFLPITVGASKGDGSDRWLSVDEPKVAMVGKSGKVSDITSDYWGSAMHWANDENGRLFNATAPSKSKTLQVREIDELLVAKASYAQGGSPYVSQPVSSFAGRRIHLIFAFPQADANGPPVFVDPLLLTLEF